MLVTILFKSQSLSSVSQFSSPSQSPNPLFQQAPGPDPKSSPSVKNQKHNTLDWDSQNSHMGHQHIGACSLPPITFNHEGVLQQGSSKEQGHLIVLHVPGEGYLQPTYNFLV